MIIKLYLFDSPLGDDVILLVRIRAALNVCFVGEIVFLVFENSNFIMLTGQEISEKENCRTETKI